MGWFEDNSPDVQPKKKSWFEENSPEVAPLADVVAPIVKATSTPARDMNRALTMPGVTTPEKTGWEKTKDFVTAPIINNIALKGGVPNIGSLETEGGSWKTQPVEQRVGDLLDEKGGGVGTGIARGVGRIAAGMTSPMNLGLLTGMGTASKGVNAAANAAFTVEQATHLPEQVKGIVDTYKDPNATSGDVAQSATEFALSTGLGAMGAAALKRDVQTLPPVQRRMAPRIESDFNAALDIGYDLGGNRASRMEARDMVDSAAIGTQQRLDKFGIVPRPLPSPQGGVVVAAPNRPPLAQQLAEGNERTAKLLEDLDKFANPPKPVIPSRELPPRQIKSAADSAAVFQEQGTPQMDVIDSYRQTYGNAPSQNLKLPPRSARGPVVPETGPSIFEQRLMDAADRAGVDYATLTPEDRAVLTELITKPDPTKYKRPVQPALPPPVAAPVPPKPIAAELPPAATPEPVPPPVKSAAESAEVFQQPTLLDRIADEQQFNRDLVNEVESRTPGKPMPKMPLNIRLTDDGGFMDQSKPPTPIRRFGGPDNYPLKPLPPATPLAPAPTPRIPAKQAEVAPLPPPPTVKSVSEEQFSSPPRIDSDMRGSVANIEVPAPGPRKEVVQPEPVDAAAPVAEAVRPGKARTWQDKGKLRIATEDLAIDPIRFQYKVDGIGQGGVTSELKDVSGWNDDAAGTIFVWEDPSNGKTYVVNGHHRYDLAKRLGQPDLGVKYIDAPNAQAARAAGALQNIREGKGSSIDAAKFLRDTGKTIADLKADNISVKGAVAKEGSALANLAPSIFEEVVHGNVDRKLASIIGEGLDNYSDQKAMLKLATTRDASLGEVTEMIRRSKAGKEPKAASPEDSGELDLFGNSVADDGPSFIFEESQISNFIRTKLAMEKRLFGAVGEQSAADRLGAAGNKIDAAANKQIADQAKEALAVYDKLSERSGPISDLLREGAKRLANGESADVVKESIYGAIRDSVAKLLPGSKPANVRKADSGGMESSDSLFQEDARQRVVEPDKPKKAVVRKAGEAGFWKPFAGNRKQLSPSELHAVEMIEKREAARRAMDGGSGVLSIGQRIWAGGKHLAEDGKANVIDKAAPLEDPPDRAIRADKGTFSVRPSMELEGAVSKVFRAKTISGQFAKDTGLIKAIQSPATAQDYGNLEQLLVARQTADIKANYAKTVTELAAAKAELKAARAGGDKALIKDLKSRVELLASKKDIATGRESVADKDAQMVRDFTPKYQQQLDLIKNHVHTLEDFMVSSGLTSQKNIDNLRKMYPNYADIHRVMPKSMYEFSNPRGIASKLSTNIIQKLKGSETLQIDDPLGNLLKKTDRVITEGLVNQAARAAAEQRQFPGMENVIREVSSKTAKKMRAEDYFTYLEDGKPRYFVAPRSFVSAAKNLDEKSIGILGQVLYSVVRLHKAGTTMFDLTFGAGNFMRDQLSRDINQTGVSKRAQHVTLANQSTASKAGDMVGLHPAIAKATVESVFNVAKNYLGKNSELYNEMVRAGGGGSSFDMFRNNPALTVKHIRAQKDGKSRVKNILTGGFRELENLIGMSEEVTRLQAFGITKARALEAGMSQADAQALGGKAARQITADFYRGGNWKRAMMAIYPYANANIQGTREQIRSGRVDPIGMTVRVATRVAIPTAILTMWNLGTPERQAAYADIQDWEKDKYFIILPENPEKDERGRWKGVKLPMPPGVSEVGGLVRRHIEAAKGGDPVTWKHYSSALFNYLSPISGSGEQIAGQSVPHAPKIMAEVSTNKNFYTNKPIVPEWMEKRAKKDQTFDSTSGTARMIGGVLDASPIMVDHVMKGFGGGVTSQVLHYTDVGRKAIADRLPDKLPGVQAMRDLPVGGESLPDKALRRFMYSQGGRTSDKQIEETKKAATVIAQENAPEKDLIWKLYKARKENVDDGEAKIGEAVRNGTLSEKAEKALDKMIDADDMEKWEKDLIRQPIAVRAVAILKMIEGKSEEEIDEIEIRMEEKGILTDKVAEEMDAREAKKKL